jgi:deazaflavin-dependent oxidoreductase (nitroreductase family)
MRSVPLIYVEDGDRYVVVASSGGSNRVPSWWRNLEVAPDALIEIQGRTIRVRGAEASASERDAIWPTLVFTYPPYDDYVARSARRIPVVLLTPTDP